MGVRLRFLQALPIVQVINTENIGTVILRGFSGKILQPLGWLASPLISTQVRLLPLLILKLFKILLLFLLFIKIFIVILWLGDTLIDKEASGKLKRSLPLKNHSFFLEMMDSETIRDFPVTLIEE